MTETTSKMFQDISKKKLIRKSSYVRILLGTFTATTIGLVFSLAHAKYRNFNFSYVKNWVKGSCIFSFLFYTGNEIMFTSANLFKIYTNFWINYSLLAYYLSKFHYRYLMKNRMMKWYNAIRYSHKCFLYFLVINLSLELIIFLIREIRLYDYPDLFDEIRENYGKNSNRNITSDNPVNTNKNEMTYYVIQNLFMKPFHVFNSKEKMNIIESHKSYKKRSNNFFLKIKTVDLYNLYKSNKMQ